MLSKMMISGANILILDEPTNHLDMEAITALNNGLIKFPGVILFIVVFLIGNVLNLAINALGAYVHTNRLTYVEFFGKFYDGGGKKFRPFAANTKYYKFKEEM